MDKRLFNKALDKIPDLVEQMAQYYANECDVKNIRQTVCYYNQNGAMCSKDVFWIYDTDLIRDIERAVKMHLSVHSDDNLVIVRRELSNGRYVIATYQPVCNGEENIA